jgi:hypothetical protein
MARSGLPSWSWGWPTVAIVGDALVVHAGVSPEVMNSASKYSKSNNITLPAALDEVSNIRFHDYWNKQAPQILNTCNSIAALRPTTPKPTSFSRLSWPYSPNTPP